MMRFSLTVLGVVTLAGGIAIGAASPAAASESSYLQQLQPKLAYLSADQMTTEGYKVCRFLSVGRPSVDAVPMVGKDLQISVPAALNIVVAAVEELC